MNKIFLEPYYGGSHKAFADKYTRSEDNWQLLTLPATKWRWRMRHAAIFFAEQINKNYPNHKWEKVLATDMMNFAEFISLAPENIRKAEKIFYFHENQLTYPHSNKTEKDYHFAFTNIISAAVADKVLFNSIFHKNEFLNASRIFLKKMPDFKPLSVVESIQKKSEVFYPYVDIKIIPRKKNPIPVITWAARWEEDKNPKEFFLAIENIVKSGIQCRINVLGGNVSSSAIGNIFCEFKQKYEHIIDNWGFVSYDNYQKILNKTDIFVSTAIHEFYGITALEAHKAGAFCLLPNRLAYPEVFKHKNNYMLYDGSLQNLTKSLKNILQ